MSEGASHRRIRILRVIQAIADHLREIPSGQWMGWGGQLTCPLANNERSMFVKHVVRMHRNSTGNACASRLRWIRGILAWWMGVGQRMTSGG